MSESRPQFGQPRSVVAITLIGVIGACSSPTEPPGQSGPSGGATSSHSGGSQSGGAVSGPIGGSKAGGGQSVGSGGESAESNSGGTTSTPGSGGSAQAGGGAPANVGGAPAPRDCENQSPNLSVHITGQIQVAALGTVFSSDTSDLTGPTDWDSKYGKSPEIIALADGPQLSVLFQDQKTSEVAHLVHLVPSTGGYTLDATYDVESLGRIMGFTQDGDGNYYVATGVDEDMEVDATYPPNGIHRPDIVRIVKFDRSGCVLMESDVDMERGAADAKSEIIVNPMVAGSSRLAYGAGQLALVHSHNTEPDPALDGTRHQKAITTHIDANTGKVTRTSSMWVSHSFDQRLFFDGTGLVELHLGDAYPRSIAVGRYLAGDKGVSRDLFHIKGPLGDNNTFTRLGSIAPIADTEFGYAVLFATERTATFEGTAEIRGTRDLALLRVRKDFAEVDGAAVDQGPTTAELTVSSSDQDATNHLKWLTDLGPNRHVERPRLVALSGDEAIALWEEWTENGKKSAFEGVFALRLTKTGEVLAGPTQLPESHHIPRGDDAILVAGRALFVGGGPGGLELNFVDAELKYERVLVP